VSEATLSVGTSFTVTVVGNTGVIGNGPDGVPFIYGSPATDAAWPADSIKLTATRLTINGQSPYDNFLEINNPNGSGAYTAVYTFSVVGTTSGATAISATQQISSGVQVKYTGSYPAVAVTIPEADPQDQTISFTGPGTTALPSGTVVVSATATSGLSVTFSSATSSVCTVSGTTVTLLAVGTCTINADQAGDSLWKPASTVPQSFEVTATGPLNCSLDFYQVDAGQLYLVNSTTGLSTIVGPRHSPGYNAMGYNTVDGYLYAISVVAKRPHVLKIGASGVPTNLGIPTPLGFAWDNSYSYVAGDTDDSGNLLVLITGGILLKINLSTMVATKVNLTTLRGSAASVGGFDLAWANGSLFSVYKKRLYKINAAGGVSSKYIAGYPVGGSSGSAFSDGAGNIFFYQNFTGRIAHVKRYGLAQPGASVVDTGRTAIVSDGASCRYGNSLSFPT